MRVCLSCKVYCILKRKRARGSHTFDSDQNIFSQGLSSFAHYNATTKSKVSGAEFSTGEVVFTFLIEPFGTPLRRDSWRTVKFCGIVVGRSSFWSERVHADFDVRFRKIGPAPLFTEKDNIEKIKGILTYRISNG